MRSELLTSLRAVMRGDLEPKTAVTHETPVTGLYGYRSKPHELQALQRLQVKNNRLEKATISPATLPVPPVPEPSGAELWERAGLCADSVAAIYLDAWSRLNKKRPLRASDAAWRLALDDGGLFLDTWGWVSESEWAWLAGELFDVPSPGATGGLIWRLRGCAVIAYGPDYVRLDDDTIVERAR
jgi:hypothetical protein